MSSVAAYPAYPARMGARMDQPLSWYPPFTLADDPGYPAHFDVAYPGRRHRPRVLQGRNLGQVTE